MEITDRVAEREVAPEDLLDKISIPDVPENTEHWEDYDGWSAGAVRAASTIPWEASCSSLRSRPQFRHRRSKANESTMNRRSYPPKCLEGKILELRLAPIQRR
jgi:hypothetical protein